MRGLVRVRDPVGLRSPYPSRYNPIERRWSALEERWDGVLLNGLDMVLQCALRMSLEGIASDAEPSPRRVSGRRCALVSVPVVSGTWGRADRTPGTLYQHLNRPPV